MTVFVEHILMHTYTDRQTQNLLLLKIELKLFLNSFTYHDGRYTYIYYVRKNALRLTINRLRCRRGNIVGTHKYVHIYFYCTYLQCFLLRVMMSGYRRRQTAFTHSHRYVPTVNLRMYDGTTS